MHDSHFSNCIFDIHSFAGTSMSRNDFPFLYVIGRSLKISPNNGGIKTFFRLDNERQYSFRNGSIFLCVFVLFWKADILS